MCQFKSFVVTKGGDVLWTEGEESHEGIIDAYKDKYDLKDDTTEPDKLKFARVEIVPPNNDVFEKDLKKWTFKIDQSITPTWWGKSLEEDCFRELSLYLKSHIIDGEDLDLIEDRKGLFINNSKI